MASGFGLAALDPSNGPFAKPALSRRQLFSRWVVTKNDHVTNCRMKAPFTFAKVGVGHSATHPFNEDPKRPLMSFFTPDLYRHLGIGFVIGAALIAAANVNVLAEELSPPAQAAEAPQAPQPASEFLIQPIT